MDVPEVIKKRRSIRAYADKKVSEKDVAKEVNAPRNLKSVFIIPVGYLAEKPGAPQKRPVSEIVHNETF